ncbi:MAG: hypothetical protein A2X46_01600 [Lentisphaerae bacterium GWF2_57_35]|nr:MAG: hypothetical protein A2X46_01600 [Lentisphaerae bacterium GWF2_57_35]
MVKAMGLFIGLSGGFLFSGQAATLTIDAQSNAWKTINPRIYGVNIANWCQHYYLKLCEPWLTNAGVTVVRYGATNLERYNYLNNRMYNVISKTNQYVPTSWESFVEWVQDDLQAEPFLQASVFGHVASDVGDADYNHEQSFEEVTDWVAAAGSNVVIWGVGNEPFIAWKLEGYQGERSNGEKYSYNDGAHGDQIYNEDIGYDAFFSRFIGVAEAIRAANPASVILGPTPANWWLYWSTDYSPYCPAKRVYPGDHEDEDGWYAMSSPVNQWNPRIFPERAGSPDVVGWEKNEKTGEFNDMRTMCQFAKRMAAYEAAHGTSVCTYLDFHRYMNADQDAVAVQETRDLWDPDYASYDKETGSSGTKTMILRRFQDIIDHYGPSLQMSLSEYDFFYWQGHPEEQQISALGQVDYLGVFAREGVQLACNWYIGEPDQSGGGYHHAADSAKQAMFDEHGNPNPKYWAFKLMSQHFRDKAIPAASSDNNMFSVYAGLDTSATVLTVAAHYKGQYSPWWAEENPGAFIEGQSYSNAMMTVSNFNITGVKKVLRYGRYDPFIVHMATGSVTVAGDSFSYEFEPLSVYLFQFYGTPNPSAEEAPATCLNVYPSTIDFGPYQTGVEVSDGVTNYSYAVKVTNNRKGGTTWSATESSDWLTMAGPASGDVDVTDRFFLTVTNRGSFAIGVHTACVTVTTSEGVAQVRVTMEVIPGEAEGETRIFDADTGSLAHTWYAEEPYSIGFYDIHGNPEDRNAPYIYTFAMDYAEKSSFGGLASMKVDFDRSAGDNVNGKLYGAFGSYGHVSDPPGPPEVWVPTGGDLADYILKIDIKSKTEGVGFTKTKLLMVITDDDGKIGKPNVGINTYNEVMEIEDGFWQTLSIPLDSAFFNWVYPGGQDGSLVSLDFSRIRQIEFCPWVGYDDKKGQLWIDNIRIETVNSQGNRYPVAAVSQSERLIGMVETVQLDGSGSYDPDGSIVAYEWRPSVGLSATNTASVVFTPPAVGTYVYELYVTDNHGVKSRNPAQVSIKVIPTLAADSLKLYSDEAMTKELSGVASNCLDVYVKMVCSAGGNATERDFVLAEVASTDVYGGDPYNDVDPIQIVLEETSPDSRIFIGQFRLAAFSRAAKSEIGFSEGCDITVSSASRSAAITIGSQSYGYCRPIDHVENGAFAFNYFGGVWCSYNDNDNNNTSVVDITASTEHANANSTQSMQGSGVLRQGPSGISDKMFGGIMTKITPLDDSVPNACTDISATTGVKGVSFWMKGNGTKIDIVLKSLSITNYDDYIYPLSHSPAGGWKRYYIPLADFYREGWGGGEAVLLEDALKRVNAIQFKFGSKINNQTNEVFVDDLAFFGGDVQYAAHSVYNKFNTLSLEGFGGLIANGLFAGSAAGWTLSGLAEYAPWGDGMINMAHWNGNSSSAGSISQQTSMGAITAGEAYKFDIQAEPGSANYTGKVYLDIVWLNAASAVISVSTTNVTAGLTYPGFKTFTTGWRTAPVGAVAARVQARSENSAVPPYSANNIKFDNAAFAGTVQTDDGWITTWSSGFSAIYVTNRVEGAKAAQIGCSLSNPDWVAGFLVAPYGMGVTETDFAECTGFSLCARRTPGFLSTGTIGARIRIAVFAGGSSAATAKTLWMPVDAGAWEDPILFSKDKFYATETFIDDDATTWAVWTGNWSDIGRVVIEYGPQTGGFDPYDVLLDNFRTCTGTYLH